MPAARRLLNVVLLLLLLVAVGCSAGKSSAPLLTAGSGAPPTAPATASVWPAALPADGVQPWEQADGAGIVMPQTRGVRSVNSSSIFAAGVDSFTTGGVVTTTGEASQLTSSTPGSHALSFATYRLTLGGAQPGVVGLDVNLNSAGSSYWVGLSDYGAGHWQWCGPFSDNHIRLVKAAGQLDSSNYLSASGNLFVAVAAYNGSSVDVIGVGANPLTDGDPALPPAPAAFAATPEPGGLLLEWTPSAASDLAGYRILWSSAGFTSANDVGVQSYDYSDGGGRLLLPLPQRYVFVAIQAIDIAGNAGPLSTEVNVVPLRGTPPALSVTASAPSGLHDTHISLTATGANSYDFDVDGDGTYDVTGNTNGHALVDTAQQGILRPSVRGHNAVSQAIALGGVSLIITGNTRPAVSATANFQAGAAPLDVTFTAVAQDTEDAPAALTYAWDFDGNGIFEPATNQASLHNVYSVPGTYNAKVRVTDSEGAWSVDTLTISVTPEDLAPTARFAVTPQQQVLPLHLNFAFDATQSSDDVKLSSYAWDFNNDSNFTPPSGTPLANHTYSHVGVFNPVLKVTDSAGQTDFATHPVYVPSMWNGHGGVPGTFTRQSPVSGPQTNHLAWSLPLDDFAESSPVLGADGTVYIGTDNGTLYAVKDSGFATGHVVWTYHTGSIIFASPCVGPDGTVYVASEDSNITALVDVGTPAPLVKWTFNTGGPIFSSPVLGPDGTVYIGSNSKKLYALTDNGTGIPTVKWTFTTGDFIFSSPVVSPDGTVIIGSLDGGLYGLLDNGTPTPILKWSFNTGDDILGSPAQGPDGTIYVANGSSMLYALVDTGSNVPTVKWSFNVGGGQGTPAIGSDGTVYFGGGAAVLYALQDNGTPVPTVKFAFPMLPAQYSSCAIGSDATVYVGEFGGLIHAVIDNGSPAGLQKWSYDTGATVTSSPTIGPDGRLYVGTLNSKLLVFGP